MAKDSFQDRYNADAAASQKGRGGSANHRPSASKSRGGKGSGKGFFGKFTWVIVVVVFVAIAWYYNKGKGTVQSTSSTIAEQVEQGSNTLKEEFNELKEGSKSQGERGSNSYSGNLPEWATTSDWFYPETPTTAEIITKTGFSLAYNEAAEQAWWVAYHLTSDELKGTLDRDNFDFDEDLEVRTGSATLKDYKSSGYDRGHLVPAADVKWNAKAMQASFLMSNVSPQKHSFNAGIWERLESRFRGWAKRDGSLYIVTGPLLKEKPNSTIGINQVWVPNSYYKVALTYKKNRWHAAAFIIDQQASGKNLEPYFLTIDEV
ncbi:MAG: DNA/RNA non-specific endonuclease, partial [Flexibacteraceae bacterium]